MPVGWLFSPLSFFYLLLLLPPPPSCPSPLPAFWLLLGNVPDCCSDPPPHPTLLCLTSPAGPGSQSWAPQLPGVIPELEDTLGHLIPFLHFQMGKCRDSESLEVPVYVHFHLRRVERGAAPASCPWSLPLPVWKVGGLPQCRKSPEESAPALGCGSVPSWLRSYLFVCACVCACLRVCLHVCVHVRVSFVVGRLDLSESRSTHAMSTM